MDDEFDIRCDTKDAAGLLDEIRRRDKIIKALINRVQSDLANSRSEFGLLQATFLLEEEVSRRTRELERTLEALTRAKSEAESARQLLLDTINAVPCGIAVFDGEDKLILCNQGSMELWFDRTTDPKDLLGTPFPEIIKDLALRFRGNDPKWIEHVLEHHAKANGTSQEQLDDGRLLQVRERKTPAGFTVGVSTDITELAELQASEAARRQLLSVIDFLPDATFALDEQGRVIAWNRAMQEITGMEKERILGQGDRAHAVALYSERRPTLLDALDSDDPELTSRYDNFHRKGTSVEGDIYLPSAYGGRGASFHLIASPLFDKEGRRVGAIECIRDVTDRKQAEADLQKLQEQLRQAVKMEAIGRLAGGIAHDFNNQLTIIQGYCKLLLRSLPSDTPLARQANEAFKAAERSAQLTKQLLAFGRKQALHSEVLDPREVLTQLRDPLSRMIGENINVEMRMGEDLCNIDVDRNQLEQAIVNLAVNARDAMPGGGKLTMEVCNVTLDSEFVLRHIGSHEGEHVCLSVRDTGTGMNEDTRARIFEPFFTTKPVGIGTGLGLSLIYGFVKQSGGYIDVLSELGKGSGFYLYFPRATDAIAHKENAPPDESCASGSETILVVEDQEALRVLTSHILESGGYRVLQAEDGYSAIELSHQYESRIDLVLSDVVMPNLMGPDLVQELVKDRPELKVIFVTGHEEGSVPGAAELKAQVLTKPFTPEMLLRVVRQVLDRATSARRAA